MERDETVPAAARALAGHAAPGARSNGRGSLNRAAVRRTRRALILQGFSGSFQATGLLLLGLTACWAGLFGDVYRWYCELKDDRSCKYLAPAGWLNPKVVESHIAGGLDQMPFLLAWGLVSRLLALSESVTRCVEGLRGSVNQFIVKILIFKTDLPWFLLSSHSGTLWHHVRMAKAPKCHAGFLHRLLVFGIYSTFFSILLFLVLSLCLGLLIRRAERQLAAERRGPLDTLIGLLVTARVREGNTNARPTARIDDQLVVAYDSAKFGSNDCCAFPPDCPICCVDFDDKEAIVQAICGSAHVFHHACLARWFETSGTCPICRASLSVNTEETSESIAQEANATLPAAIIGNSQATGSQVAASQAEAAVQVGDSFVQAVEPRASQEQSAEAEIAPQPAIVMLPGNLSNGELLERSSPSGLPTIPPVVVEPLIVESVESEDRREEMPAASDSVRLDGDMLQRPAQIGWSIRDQ